MKHRVWMTLGLMSGLSTISSFAQSIQNASFEIGRSTNALLPDKWGLKKSEEFAVTLDSTVASSGKRSLKITCTVQSPASSQGFGQSFPVQVSQPTKLHLRMAVRTKNTDDIGLFCQLWHDQKQMSMVSLPHVSGTGEWRDIALELLVTPHVNRIFFAADYRGNQQVWFDDIRLQVDSLSAAKASPKVVAYLNQAAGLVKKHALVRDSIPWQQTQTEMLAFAGGMQTEQEAHSIIDYLVSIMKRYGDNHSFFSRPEQVQKLYSSQLDQPAPQPQAKYLGDGVGYVAVPQFMNLNKTRKVAFATQIQALIRGIDSAHSVSNWVVDLRGNRGGSVWPMVGGLVPIYGKAVKGAYKRTTKVRHPYRLRQAPNRIAVLIDSQTGSSGEFAALSFIGLPNVRSFGTHSGGYTTGNTNYKLRDGSMLFIADSVGEDRAGRKYMHGIEPDEEIKAISTPVVDPTSEAAKVWLLTK